MTDAPYSKRELDEKLSHIVTTLSRMESKLDYTNGKVKRLYLIMACIGSVVVTLLVTNGSELVNVIKIII